MSDGWTDSPGSPARKDTRTWCKGKVGREHQLVIEPDKRQGWGPPGCFWSSSWFLESGTRSHRWSWHCRHIERCTVCGKILRHWLKQDECPEIRPTPGDDVECKHCQMLASEHHGEHLYCWPDGRRWRFWYSERDGKS